jgi:SAM-dependent methyltransferase
LGFRIEYSALDLNEATLPRSTYDAIFILSAAHHVFELEHLFAHCHAALKPGGLLILDEYIGPSRFQTSAETVALINDLLATLPRRLRRNLLARNGSTIDSYGPASINYYERTDPSEAVRSSEIMSERDAAVLDVLCKFEQHLEAAGIIESDFAAIVARPRPDIVVPPLQFTPKQPRQAAKAGAKKRRKRPASVPPRKRRR